MRDSARPISKINCLEPCCLPTMNGAVICSCATAGNDKTIMPTQSQLVTYVLCRMHDCFLHISAAGRFKRHGSLVGMIVDHKPLRRTSMFGIPSRFAMSTPVRAQLLAIQSSLRPFGALLIATRESPLPLLPLLLARLAPSAAFAIYNPSPQPLAECLHFCHRENLAVRLQLLESWTRKYQASARPGESSGCCAIADCRMRAAGGARAHAPGDEHIPAHRLRARRRQGQPAARPALRLTIR